MANDSFFINISFDINYESSSGEEETGEKALTGHIARSAAFTSTDLDELEKKRHENNTAANGVGCELF